MRCRVLHHYAGMCGAGTAGGGGTNRYPAPVIALGTMAPWRPGRAQG